MVKKKVIEGYSRGHHLFVGPLETAERYLLHEHFSLQKRTPPQAQSALDAALHPEFDPTLDVQRLQEALLELNTHLEPEDVRFLFTVRHRYIVCSLFLLFVWLSVVIDTRMSDHYVRSTALIPDAEHSGPQTYQFQALLDYRSPLREV